MSSLLFLFSAVGFASAADPQCQCTDRDKLSIALISQFQNSYLPESGLIDAGVSQATKDRMVSLNPKYVPQLGQAYSESDALAAFNEAIDQNVAGIVTTMTNDDPEFIALIKKASRAKIPTYIVGGAVKDAVDKVRQIGLVNYVGQNEEESAEEVARRLIAAGVTSLICMTFDNQMMVHEKRCQIIVDAITANGGKAKKQQKDLSDYEYNPYFEKAFAADGYLGSGNVAVVLNSVQGFKYVQQKAQAAGAADRLFVATYEESADTVSFMKSQRDGQVMYIDQQIYLQSYTSAALIVTEKMSTQKFEVDITTGPKITTRSTMDSDYAQRQVCKAAGFPVCEYADAAMTRADKKYGFYDFAGSVVKETIDGCPCYDRHTSRIVSTSHFHLNYRPSWPQMSGFQQVARDMRGIQVAWEISEHMDLNEIAGLNNDVATGKNPATALISGDAMNALGAPELADSLKAAGDNPNIAMWFSVEYIEVTSKVKTSEAFNSMGYVGYTTYSGGYKLGELLRAQGKKSVLGVVPWLGAPNAWEWNFGLVDALTGKKHDWTWPLADLVDDCDAQTGNFAVRYGTDKDGNPVEGRITCSAWVDGAIGANFVPPVMKALRREPKIDSLMIISVHPEQTPDMLAAIAADDSTKNRGITFAPCQLTGAMEGLHDETIPFGLDNQMWLQSYTVAMMAALYDHTHERILTEYFDCIRIIDSQTEFKYIDIPRYQQCENWGDMYGFNAEKSDVDTALTPTADKGPVDSMYYPVCNYDTCGGTGANECSGHGRCKFDHNYCAECRICPEGTPTDRASLSECLPKENCRCHGPEHVQGVCECDAEYMGTTCNQKRNCDPGQELDLENAFAQCTDCPPGTYYPGKDIASWSEPICKRCPSGQEPITADGVVGEPGSIGCQACPDGYEIQDGWSKCEPCGTGHFRDPSEIFCSSCSSGRFADKTGMTSCLPCAKGQYQSSEAQASCDKCTQGTTTQDLGTSRDDQCIAGEGAYFSENKMHQETCPDGMTCTGGFECKTRQGSQVYWPNQPVEYHGKTAEGCAKKTLVLDCPNRVEGTRTDMCIVPVRLADETCKMMWERAENTQWSSEARDRTNYVSCHGYYFEDSLLQDENDIESVRIPNTKGKGDSLEGYTWTDVAFLGVMNFEYLKLQDSSCPEQDLSEWKVAPEADYELYGTYPPRPETSDIRTRFLSEAGPNPGSLWFPEAKFLMPTYFRNTRGDLAITTDAISPCSLAWGPPPKIAARRLHSNHAPAGHIYHGWAVQTADDLQPWVQEEGTLKPYGYIHLQPVLLEGFWVSKTELAADKSTNDFDIYRCNNGDCYGGRPGQVCKPFRSLTERGCHKCIKDHYANGRGDCTQCGAADGAPFVLLFVFLVAILPFVFHSVVNGEMTAQTTSTLLTAVALGMLFNCGQVMMVLYQIDIVWQEPFRSLLQFLTVPILLDLSMLRPECVTETMDYFTVYFLKMLTPALAVLLYIIGYAASRFLPEGSRFRMSRDKVYNTVGMMMQVFFVSLAVNTTEPLLKRTNYGGAEDTSQMFPSLFFMKDQHLGIVIIGVLGLIFYVFAFVFVVHWVLFKTYRSPEALHTDAFKTRFRFFMYRFGPRFYWFGIVLVLRGLLAAFVPVLMPKPSIQLIVLAFIMICSGTITAYSFPWRTRSLNLMDIITANCIALICFAGNTYPATGSVGSSDEQGFFDVFVLLVTLFSFGSIACIILYALVKLLVTWKPALETPLFPIVKLIKIFNEQDETTRGDCTKALCNLVYKSKKITVEEIDSLMGNLNALEIQNLSLALSVLDHDLYDGKLDAGKVKRLSFAPKPKNTS